jgi:hypothetical protein
MAATKRRASRQYRLPAGVATAEGGAWAKRVGEPPTEIKRRIDGADFHTVILREAHEGAQAAPKATNPQSAAHLWIFQNGPLR